MADNASEQIKTLSVDVQNLDKRLQSAISHVAEYDKEIALWFEKARVQGMAKTDQLVDYLAKRFKNLQLKTVVSPFEEALGLKEAKQEVEKVPTMFERVINEINAKAANKRGFWANELFHSEFAVEQAKKNFARVYREFTKDVPIAQASFAPELQRLYSIDQSILSKSDLKKLQDRIAQVKKDLESVSKLQGVGDAYKDPSLLEALKRYQDALEKVRQAKEQIAALDGKEGNRYAANASMVEGVTRKFNENEQALAKLQQRWEELNVKKQAGLISQKDFDAQTQKILDEYDRLIAKRKEFEIGDLGQMSYQRKSEREQEEERLAQLRKSNTQARLDDEMRAEKMIKAERAKREAKENAAIREQVTNYKQLSDLLKQYNSLKQVKGRTQEEEAALERTRQKIKEIIAEMRKLDSDQKGSLGKARDITEYDRILAKDKEITNEKKKQNDLTKQQKANLNNLLPTLQRLASAFGIAFSIRGLAQFGKKLIEVRGEFELQQVALRSILQNKQLADEIWDKTMQAALQSPFTAMQLTKYTKQLAAYRIETEKLFDTTKRLADVSAGLGVDMQRLILAYGQVKAANYLRASEIRQFTEAGVNILGELSQYFTEAKGEMVSTAQVMDMVQKRMVKFEDVAEIFKRMTDQGGIFYNMQYVQSQTVKGQLMKLRDAYDQMLNTIGKGNEGTIKNLISLLNNMVRNWREIAGTIKSIGFGAVVGWLSKYAFALTGVTKASVGTLRSMAELRKSVISLGAAFKANWPLFAIGAVVAGITKLIEMAKRMDAVNKELDEQNMKLYETRQNFEELRYKIQLNNSYIEDETSSEKENTQAKEANRAIMQKLINEYPELAAQMEINENGLINMNEALDVNIRKLNEQMTIVHAMKAQHWFADTDRENLDEWEQSLSIIKTKMLSLQNAAKNRMMLLEREGKMQTKAYEIYEELSRIDLSGNILDAVAAFDKLEARVRRMDIGEINKQLGRQAAAQAGFSYYQQYALSSTLGQMPGERDFSWSQNRAIDVLEKQQGALLEFYKNGIRDNAKYLEEIIEQYNGNIDAFIKDNAGRLNKDTAEGINKANEIFIKTLAPQSDEMKSYLNKYFNNLLGVDEMAFVRAEARLGWLRKKVEEHEALPQLGMLENPDRIAAYEAILKEIDQLESFLKNRGIDFFATAENIGGTTEPNFELNAANLRKQVNLLEEMKKRYDELSKSAYGYAKSEEKVRQAFKDSFEEIFKGTGIEMKDIDFTSMEGLSASIQKVLDAATNIKEEVKQEIMKKIDSYEARIEIDAQVRVRENFAREIEKMFSDYELTLELQKLNISPSAAKNLFPELGYKTMGDLQDRMRRFYQEQVAAGGFDEKDLETYRKFADKIDSEILKERKDRAKQYSKFLEQEYSERAKVEMQYAQDVAFVTTNFEGAQRENILKGLQQKFSKDISELNWKSFKESDFYLDMMEDLSSLPKDYLDMMLKKIEQVLTENKDGLSPRTLKEIVKARQRVLDAQIKLRPLDVMRSSIEGIRDASKDKTVGGDTWRATNKNLKENIKLQAEQIAQFDEEILSLQKLQGELAGYEEQTARFKAISSRIDLGVLNSLLGLGEGESIADVGTMEISDITELIERLTAELEAAKNAYDPSQKTDEMNKLAVEISQREIMIKLLGEELEIRREMSEYQLSPQAVDAMEQGQTSAGIGAQISEVTGKKETTEKRQLKFKEWLKSFDNFGEAYKELNKNINNTITSVANAGSAFYDMFDALGGETDALTEGWKEFGNTLVDTVTQTLTMIPMMVAAFTAAGIAINSAMGIIGLIAEAIQLTITLITFLVQLSDKQKDKEIENLQKRIDELKNAYERLEKQIEKTWDTMSYIENYDKMVKNLNEQIRALEAQRQAENDKKKTDEDKISDYNKAIQDAKDELEKLKQKQIEVFGGIGNEGYRDTAQGFVDAWKSAFLETGDGLQGLQEHFDEFLNDWFVKQATMRYASAALEPVFKMIDDAVSPNGAGGANVVMQELENIKEWARVNLPQISDTLEEISRPFIGEGEGSLSGLAAGIQGMTEEQANILEACLNSVRGYTASIDMNVSRIADMLGAGSRDITNPQLQQLELIAHNTASIQRMFESVVMSGHTRGQSGIRVFVD